MDFKNVFLFYIFLCWNPMYSLCIKSLNSKPQTTDIMLTEWAKEDDLKATTTNNSVYIKYFETSKVNPTTMANIEPTIKSPCNNYCNCGIFLGSQFVKGSSLPLRGNPVISTTLEHLFPCNPIGQKQCQRKCLEKIFQHLPNSANILCAILDRDIRKEKAFLFIRNCSDKWHNTNLAAGREYCCKNGLPYICPKK